MLRGALALFERTCQLVTRRRCRPLELGLLAQLDDDVLELGYLLLEDLVFVLQVELGRLHSGKLAQSVGLRRR